MSSRSSMLQDRRKRTRVSRERRAKLRLKGVKKPELVQSGQAGKLLNGFVKVTVDDIAIHRLIVPEESRQTGWIEIDIEGQTTVLRWEKPDETLPADVAVNPGRVLYAGRPGGVLSVAVRIVESDQKEKQFLENLAAFLEAGAGVAALVPVYGAAISPGLTIAKEVVSYAAANVFDDLELQYVGSVSKGNENNQNTHDFSIVRARKVKLVEKEDIRIPFKIEKLDVTPATGPEFDEVALVIESFDLGDGVPGLDAKDQMVFEVAAGADASSEPFRIVVGGVNGGDIGRFVGAANVVAYRGPWKHALSLTASLSVMPVATEDDDTELPFNSTIQTAAGLVKTIKPEFTEDIDQALAFVQPVSELIAAVTPQTEYSISGSAVMVDVDSDTAETIELAGQGGQRATIQARLVKTGRKIKVKPTGQGG